MALQDYSALSFFVDGQLLLESTDITVDDKPNLQPVYTQQKGFSGMSPGAGEVEIKISGAMPRAGVEFDARKASQEGRVLELLWFTASKKCSTKGYCTGVTTGSGVNKAASYDYTFLASPVEETTL